MTPRAPPSPGAAERRRRHLARGRWSEAAAAAWLMAKGYRILARRVRTPLGEIDIVAARGGRIAFVEVKLRAGSDGPEAAVGARQRERIRRAAEHWIARRPRYQQHEMGFDIVLVGTRLLPRHLPNAL